MNLMTLICSYNVTPEFGESRVHHFSYSAQNQANNAKHWTAQIIPVSQFVTDKLPGR